jgi:hypothetical protein
MLPERGTRPLPRCSLDGARRPSGLPFVRFRTAARPTLPVARRAVYARRRGATVPGHVRGLGPYHRGRRAVHRPAGPIRHPVGRAALRRR